MKPTTSTFRRAFLAAVEEYGHPVLPMLSHAARSGYVTGNVSGYYFCPGWRLTLRATRKDFLAFVKVLNKHLPKTRQVAEEKLNAEFFSKVTPYRAMRERLPQ